MSHTTMEGRGDAIREANSEGGRIEGNEKINFRVLIVNMEEYGPTAGTYYTAL